MIFARHTYLGSLIGRYYAGYKLGQAFKNICLSGEGSDDGTAILLIANHFSWWDGFIQYRLNRSVFKRNFYVMMQEEQLIRYKVLREGGAFSIRKGSRQLLQSLCYCADLLKEESNLVLLFPQGSIQSLYTSPFSFQQGLGYLFKHVPGRFQLVFNVNLIDYFSDRQPSLSVYYRKYEDTWPFVLSKVEEAFNTYAETCRQQQIRNR